MDEKVETRIVYERNAVIFKEKFDNIPPRVKDIELGLSFVKKKNPKVLEIGCAYGRDAKEILKRTKNYIGIDYSEEMIKLAKKDLAKVEFIVADALTFRYPKKQDFIFSFASLVHTDKEEMSTIIQKIHESLDEKGIFLLSLKYGKYEKITKNETYGKRIYYMYTPSVIEKISKTKFEVIHKNVQILRGQKWFEIILQKK